MSYNFTDFITSGTTRSSYRFTTCASGRYRTRSRWWWRKTLIRDISLGGICLGGVTGLRVGQQLQIALPVIGKIGATVRWAEGDSAGCAFATKLDPVLLDAFVLKVITEQTSGEHADT